MEKTETCPICKTTYEAVPNTCSKCRYPFSATEKEKSVFIGQYFVKSGKISDTKDAIKRARIILWIIGGSNVIIPYIKFFINPVFSYDVVIGPTIGLIFIVFGFYSYKKPLISIWIPLVLLLLFYTSDVVVDSANILRGIIWKALYTGVLIYCLISIYQSEKIKKESNFLKDQDYK